MGFGFGLGLGLWGLGVWDEQGSMLISFLGIGKVLQPRFGFEPLVGENFNVLLHHRYRFPSLPSKFLSAMSWMALSPTCASAPMRWIGRRDQGPIADVISALRCRVWFKGCHLNRLQGFDAPSLGSCLVGGSLGPHKAIQGCSPNPLVYSSTRPRQVPF